MRIWEKHAFERCHQGSRPQSEQWIRKISTCILGINEPHHSKTNKMACVPSEDTDQPGHPPSRIRVFAVRMKKAWVLSYPLSAQRRLWSDWADAQADLSLCWAHSHFVGFVMRWLKKTLFPNVLACYVGLYFILHVAVILCALIGKHNTGSSGKVLIRRRLVAKN